MKLREACNIFESIESSDYTDEEKAEAIYNVTQMTTHNSITKTMMLKVIWWLLNLAFDLPEGTEPPKF